MEPSIAPTPVQSAAPSVAVLVLTPAEAEELAQLIDAAVRARGVAIAAVAVKYLDKINAALQTANKS